MKKPRFGRENPGPTREELEKEAARELERMTRQAGGPPPSGAGSGWSSAPPPPASSPSSLQPRFASGSPVVPAQPSVRERFESRGQQEQDDEEEGDYSEEEMVTELALRDWSERSGRGRSIEDLALPRLDAKAVEAQRDRALREFTERQARMERESEAHRIQRQALGLTPPSRAGTVNLTAARPMGMLNLSAQAAGMRGQGASPSAVPAEPSPKARAKPAAPKKAAKGANLATTETAKTRPKKSATKAGAKPGPRAATRSATKPAATKKAKSPATKTTKAPVTKAKGPINKAKAPVAKAKAPATRTAKAAASRKIKPAATETAKVPAKAKPAPRKGSGRR